MISGALPPAAMRANWASVNWSMRARLSANSEIFPPPPGRGQRPYGRRLVGVRPFLHLLMPSLFIARITDIAFHAPPRSAGILRSVSIEGNFQNPDCFSRNLLDRARSAMWAVCSCLRSSIRSASRLPTKNARY